MWQVLYEELAPRGFELLAIALDTAGERAARAFAEADGAREVPEAMRRIMGWDEALWQRAARPRFPCLVDVHHVFAQRYDVTNVPTAVWIDEQGRLVRPPEPAGAIDTVRQLDPTTFTIPEALQQTGRAARAFYLEAIRDWVAKGEASAFALAPEDAARRAGGVDPDAARATAHFQLATALWARGERAAAGEHFERAVALRPEAWSFRRQKIAVADDEAIGDFAATPEFWKAVQELGDQPYYPEIDMPGMPRAGSGR